MQQGDADGARFGARANATVSVYTKASHSSVPAR